MTLYVGLRNYSDIKTGLRVRKGETVEIDVDVTHLLGDVFGHEIVVALRASTQTAPEAKPFVDLGPVQKPELDIEIDLGADDLSQKPNRKRTAQKDRN
jgi:hypothetical protein